MNKLETVSLNVMMALALMGGAEAAELVRGQKYMALQIGASSTLAGAQQIARQAGDLPHVRIVRIGGRYLVRAGFWDNAAEAQNQLNLIKARMPQAAVLSSQYLPELFLPLEGTAAAVPATAIEGAAQSNLQLGASTGRIAVDAGNSRLSDYRRQQRTVQAEDKQQRNIVTESGTDSPLASRDSAEESSSVPMPRKVEAKSKAPVASAAEPKPTNTVRVDERPLWQLFNDRKFAETRMLIERLQSTYATWRPPVQLVQLLDKAEREDMIKQRLAQATPEDLQRMARDPSSMLGCATSGDTLAIAERLAKLGDVEGSRLLFSRLVPKCPTFDIRLAALYKARDVLPNSEFEMLLLLERSAGQRDGKGDKELSKLMEVSKGPNETPLWDLYKRQQFDQYDALVAQLKRDFPRWSPPANLAGLVEESRKQQRLARIYQSAGVASNASSSAPVVESSTAMSAQAGQCSDYRTIWRDAEKAAQSGDTSGARQQLEALVPGCNQFGVRLGTLQAAKRFLPEVEFKVLVKREREAGIRNEAEDKQLLALVGKVAGPDEQVLIGLAEQRRFEELRVLVASLKQEFPDWTPSARLQSKMQEGQRVANIDRLIADGDLRALRAFVTNGSDGLGCEDPGTLVKVAEALSKAGDVPRAVGLMRRIVPKCTPSERRIDALADAAKWLPTQEFQNLVLLERAAGNRDAAADRKLKALLDTPRGPDERPLWELVNAGRIADLQGVIEQLRVEFPGWQPPAALMKAARDKQRDDAMLVTQRPAQSGATSSSRGKASFDPLLDDYPATTQPAKDYDPLIDDAPAPRRKVPQESAIDRSKSSSPRTQQGASLNEHDEGIRLGDGAVIRPAAYNPAQPVVTPVARQQEWSLPEPQQKRAPAVREAASCKDTQRLWDAAEGWLDAGDEGKAYELMARVVPFCNSFADRIATLNKARDWLSQPYFERLLDAERRGGQRTAEETEQLRQVVRDVAVKQLTEAYANNDLDRAQAALRRLSRDIAERRDGDLAALAGWVMFRMNNLQAARAWFDRARQYAPESSDGRYGAALVAFRQGEVEDSRKLVGDMDDERSRKLRADLAFARAQQYYDGGDYERAMDALRESATLGKRDRGLRNLLAWVHYQTGEASKSADEFLALYREQQDSDAALGVSLAMRRAKRDGDLTALVEAAPKSILASEAYRTEAEPLYYSKHFAAAAEHAPGANKALEGVAGPWVGTSISARSRAGDPGTTQFNITQVPAGSASFSPTATTRVTVRAQQEIIDAGKMPATNAPVGSMLQNTAYVAPKSNEAVQSATWYADVEHDGATSWSAGVGQTAKGPLGRSLVAHARVVSDTGDSQVGGEISRTAVKDSKLSYVGMVDPYSGVAWGKVTRNAMSVFGNTPIDEDFRVNGKMTVAEFRGVSVPSNNMGEVSGGISHDFKVRGFDFLTAGPEVRYTTYGNNFANFGFGSGGYDSPQSEVALDGAVQFQTKEAARTIWAGRLQMGWLNRRTGEEPCTMVAAPVQPASFASLQPGCGTTASASNGFFANGELYGTGLSQSKHWQWGLGVGVRQSPYYSDISGNVSLKYWFEPRNVSLSSDLPKQEIKSLY
ncbi:BCSC C-terminal domain-containing protein [Burkholderiaceae bacterium DAT-1]|nr:BCSC C-terminal domain-containing protein [Burkholderiaceae bacterium DAT-1]